MAQNERTGELRQLLSQRPASASTLAAALRISQPTFSRLWPGVPDGVTLGASKARLYALRRPVAGVAAPIPLFRVGDDGQVTPAGHITPLQGGFYARTPPDGGRYELFEGMPYFLRDLRPQGFLGRLEPGKHPDLGLPADILRWTDEQALIYCARRSEHTAGDLILGNESYARYLADLPRAMAAVIPDDERTERYPSMAEQSMQGDPPGSSAGGEQPKFTATVRRHGAPGCIEHVIVKFSPPVGTASGRRWGDLLVCVHLALAVLARHQIAAAATTIVAAGGRIFLEVVRFDRLGLHGRRPMATLSALDGDLGMLDQPWTAVARELGRLGALPAQDVTTVEMLDLFGALIGNTDRHRGNLAVSWDFGQRHRLLDAYDMLPMLYRPNTHGEIIERTWLANLAGGLELRHLGPCLKMADQFWADVLNDVRISDDFKQDVAVHHRMTLHGLDQQVR